jgi:hypothetical protein
VMYGRRNPYGSGGHGDNLRPHRLSLKAYAAVGTVQWAAQRRATRLTPFLMALGYFPGTPLAMYLPVPWEVLAMLGVLCTLTGSPRRSTPRSVRCPPAPRPASRARPSPSCAVAD